MAGELNILELPEGCIADVLALTTPKDACRLALEASCLRSAAQSDTVWERFLPLDCFHIIGRSNKSRDFFTSFASKKELYLYLCDNHILIDGDTKSFSLEKGSGKKCYMLGARDLHIDWSDTPKHWQWISLPKSRFPEVAELICVYWLEIIGKIKTNMLSPNTTYGAYLVFTTISGLKGFNYPFAEGTVKISGFTGSGGETTTTLVCFDPDRAWKLELSVMLPHEVRQLGVQDLSVVKFPDKRSDGWLEVELGQFFVKEERDDELEMSFKQVSGRKEGLFVEVAGLRPCLDRRKQMEK